MVTNASGNDTEDKFNKNIEVVSKSDPVENNPKDKVETTDNLTEHGNHDIVVENKGDEGTCSSNDLKENKEAINVTEQVEVGERQNAKEGKEVSDVNEKPGETVMDSIKPERAQEYNSL